MSSSLLDILNKTTDFFRHKGIENARLDAQLLLGHALGLKRLELYLNFDRPLTEEELERCRGLVKRRSAREPLQHILGEAPFRELRLKVDGRALIPRQETELLLELAKPFLEEPAAARVLDLGVGTGAILLSVLKEYPASQVWGSDLEPGPLELTRANALHNELVLPEEALKQGHLFEPFPAEQKWNVILSNPPYIGEGELAGLQPEVRDHDPRAALIGGQKGWELAAELISQAKSRLEPEGVLILELGPGQPEILRQRFAPGWKRITESKDYSGVVRFLVLEAAGSSEASLKNN